MPIHFPSTLPNPSTMSMGIEHNVQSTTSPFTGARQTYELNGAKWKFSATWDIITPEDVPTFRAFLARLRGGASQFYYSDVSQTEPLGSMNTNAVVTSSPSDESIVVSTPQGSETIFRAGDYIEVPIDGGENEYKMVLEDVATDAAGDATIEFSPQLRGSVDIGENVVYSSPAGVFVVDEKASAMNISAPYNGESVTISATEWMV